MVEIDTDKLLINTEAFIFKLFKDKLPQTMLYHNYKHTQEVVSETKKMAKHYELNEGDSLKVILAAWFHDTGYIFSYKNHEDESVKVATDFLKKQEADKKLIEEVNDLILSTKIERIPKNLLEEILHDADMINIGKKRFFYRSELLRMEWESCLDLTLTNDEWNRQQLEFLKKNNFYTSYCINERANRRAKNIRKQISSMKKDRRKEKKLGRGIETMYRAIYRNHINLSSIADNKANMMISINTIIFSVIVAVVGSGFSLSGQSFLEHMRFTIPICMLMVGSLVSVIFAILSASPKVTSKEVNKKEIKKQRKSALFFGNYVNMELEKFIESLQLFRDKQSMVYDNMSVDLYYLGIVLRKKYKLLSVAYMTFMASLCLSGLAFLIIFIGSLK